MPTPDIRKIIEARGGYRAVSEALTKAVGYDVPATTVHAWYRKNKIPAWRAEMVMNLPKVAKQRAAA